MGDDVSETVTAQLVGVLGLALAGLQTTVVDDALWVEVRVV
jgi:hypothetical protein